jgi:predicted nucleic acid-binding protein
MTQSASASATVLQSLPLCELLQRASTEQNPRTLSLLLDEILLRYEVADADADRMSLASRLRAAADSSQQQPA